MMRRYAPHSTTATQRALAAVSHDYPTGWCLRFAATDILGVPGAHTADWDNDPGCIEFWEAAKAHGEVIETNDPKRIPAPSIAIWTGGPYGHAAFVHEAGQGIGTDFPDRGRIGQFPIADLDWEGYELVGAILIDGNGYIYAPRPADWRPTYKVTADGGAHGYTRPDTSARGGKKLRKGTKVQPTLTQVRFKAWAEIDGTFYQLEDLGRLP